MMNDKIANRELCVRLSQVLDSFSLPAPGWNIAPGFLAKIVQDCPLFFRSAAGQMIERPIGPAGTRQAAV